MCDLIVVSDLSIYINIVLSCDDSSWCSYIIHYALHSFSESVPNMPVTEELNSVESSNKDLSQR